MTLEIPQKFSFEFLEKNIDKPEWAEYVIDNHEMIMDNLENCPFEEACWALSYALSIWVGEKEDSKRIRQANELIIRISRMGLNKLGKMHSKKEIHPLLLIERQADLLTKCAIAMINVGRPIAALDLFGTAERIFLELKSVIPKDQKEMIRGYGIEYETIRAKEAEIGVRIVHYIPKEHRPLFASAAFSYLTHSINNLYTLGDAGMANYFAWNIMPYAEGACLQYLNWKQEDIDALNTDTITDDHQRWCQGNYLFLNIMNEIPHNSARFAKDDIQLDLDERHQYLLDDIIRTYSHCRRLFHGLEPDRIRLKTERDEDVERLIDCYVRLYTLFDKCGKLLNHLYPQDFSDDKFSFYDVARKMARENNPYLKAIDMICSDVFPDRASKNAGITDPRNSFNGHVMWRGFLRNSIIHNTFRLKPDMESDDFIKDVAYVSAFEIYHATLMTFHDIREIVLNIQLADGYTRDGWKEQDQN